MQAVRKDDGWVVSNKTSNVYLSHNQYGRFLAWQRSKHSIDDMFPDLSDADREILSAFRDT